MNQTQINAWADSVYHQYYFFADIDRKAIDSVLAMMPPDSMTEGKEKLFRIIADYYHKRGNYSVAFPYLMDAEKSLRRRKDSARWAIVLGAIGEEYRAFGEYENADSVLSKGLELALESGDTMAIAYVSGRYAGALFELNMEDSAAYLPLYRLSVKYFQALGDLDEVASHLGEMAVVYTHKGRFDKAIDQIRKADFDRIRFDTKGRLFLSLANTFYQKGEFDSTLFYARIAYNIGQTHDRLIYAFESSAIIQKSLDSLGRMEEAYEWAITSRNRLHDYYYSERGSDVKVAKLEHERELQRIANQYLRNERELRMAENERFKMFLVIAMVLLAIVIFIALLLLRNRRKLKNFQTNLMEVNAEIEAKNQELEKYLEVRDRMISVVSHDLRSPLASLMNLIDVLKDPEMEREEIEEVLPMMESQIRNTIDFADNLILWVKSQLKGVESFPSNQDMIALTQEIIELSKPNWHNAKVNVKLIADGDVNAYVDVEMTKFILRNLIHNAVKFSSAGQEVKIRLDQFRNKVTVCIEDEGRGMTKAEIDELFVMGKSKQSGPGKGAGIGLYLSHYFADLMNGSLRAESEPNKGSRFIVELPAKEN